MCLDAFRPGTLTGSILIPPRPARRAAFASRRLASPALPRYRMADPPTRKKGAAREKALSGSVTARTVAAPANPASRSDPGPRAELLMTCTLPRPSRPAANSRNPARFARGSRRKKLSLGNAIASGIPGRPAPLPTSTSGPRGTMTVSIERQSRICSVTKLVTDLAPVRFVAALCSITSSA